MPVEHGLVPAGPHQRLRLHEVHGRLLDADDPVVREQLDQFLRPEGDAAHFGDVVEDHRIPEASAMSK